MRYLVALLIFAPIVASGETYSLDGEWVWFRALSTGASWFQTNGKGTITGCGNTFRAELYDGKDPKFLRHQVTGSNSGTAIKARVVVMSSDVGPSTLTGKLKRFCYKGGGSEVIFLYDETTVRGLSRALPKGALFDPTP